MTNELLLEKLEDIVHEHAKRSSVRALIDSTAIAEALMSLEERAFIRMAIEMIQEMRMHREEIVAQHTRGLLENKAASNEIEKYKEEIGA